MWHVASATQRNETEQGGGYVMRIKMQQSPPPSPDCSSSAPSPLQSLHSTPSSGYSLPLSLSRSLLCALATQ